MKRIESSTVTVTRPNGALGGTETHSTTTTTERGSSSERDIFMAGFSIGIVLGAILFRVFA